MGKVKRFEVWLANLDPRFGTETGKTRPVLVVQTDLLNKVHPSTLVCSLALLPIHREMNSSLVY
ncbi:type II toxin-antitoxin system PemK/MazF family toxin [Mongoliibacter ruber]|uniref:type II toxin-antitoxin system PemK/MazF family toxin n=1 Tax=Mongoliibacter ruber TaxID=1750599 RepID=UPI000D06211F|nr:type II toxin-antitoxin system PemK/MazF family toxin [Mongoliibacter ruber]